jgi:hypothetical protein
MRWHIRMKEKLRFIIIYNKMAKAYLKHRRLCRVKNMLAGPKNIVESPVLDNYARESFDINRENACVFCSPGFYLWNTTSLRKKEKMTMLGINVCMNIIFIVSDIYAHFLIPKITPNSPGHCLKYTFVM